ncbi:hypothetical protein ScPMuIL_010473 [Solemya velum]
MSNVPQWKHDLLGRKAHSDERFDRMQSNVPGWKREILMRKNKILDTICTTEKFSSSSNSSGSSSRLSPRTSMRSSTGSDVFPYDETDQENSYPLNSSQRVIADHLESVHDNPFFRAQGKILAHREGKEDENSISENGNNLEEEEEYSPFSGIVNKLCKKFSNLSANEAPTRTASKPKRSASLENLLDTHHCHRHDVRFYSNSSQNDELKNTKEPVSSRLSGGSTGSSDCLNHISAVYKQGDGRQLHSRRSSDLEQKHYVAPDLVIGRRKIEIIDLPSLPKERSSQTVARDPTETKVVLEGKNELPKPNTVSNFRSIFETGSNKTETDREFSRRRSPISPPVSNTLSQSDLFTTRPFTAWKYNRMNEKNDSKLTMDKSSFPSDKGSGSSTHNPNNTLDDNDEEVWTSSTEIRYIPVTRSPPESPSIIDQKQSDSLTVNILSHNGELNHSDFVIPAAAEDPNMHIDRSIKPFHELKSNFESSVGKSNEEKENYHQSRYNARTTSNFLSSDQNKQVNTNVSNSAQLPNEKTLSGDNVVTTISVMEESSKVPQPDRDYIPSSISDKKLLFDSHSIMSDPTRPPLPSRTDKMETSKKPPLVPKSVSEDNKLGKHSNIKTKPLSSEVRSAKLSNEDQNLTKIENSKTDTEHAKVDSPPNSTRASILRTDATKVVAASPEVHRKEVFDSSSIKSVAMKDKPPKVPSRRRDLDKSKNILLNGSVDSTQANLTENQNMTESNASITVEKQEPVKGIPSILANRLNTKSGLHASTESSQRVENSIENEGLDDGSLVLPSSLKRFNTGPLAPPVINRKPKSHHEDTKSDSNTTLLVLTDDKREEPIPQSNIDDIIGVKKKEVKAYEIFSSDSIVPVVSKGPKRKRPLDVPPLNLPQEEESTGYIPTKIKPCPYVFIGAPVLLSSQPLKKTKKKKLAISFNDSMQKIFEYTAEKHALEDYLVEHPEEREELLKLEAIEAGKTSMETSDEPEISTSETVSGSLKTTPFIANPSPIGDLVSYKSKMQGDFQFGVHHEEEINAEPETEPAPMSEEDMHLLPADEDDLSNWSKAHTSDMLF